jgi:uncharacterized protein
MKVYHHNDLDGRCAAAIVLKAPSMANREIKLIEVDYKDIISVNDIEPNEMIVIVDFSFKPEIMNEVCKKTSSIVWIDHHKTAFEHKYDCPPINGIRSEYFAGCELAWMFYFGKKPMPLAVTLLGDYDKWALKFKPQCFEFYEGMKMFVDNPRSGLWDDLFRDDLKVPKIIEVGKIAIQYRDNYCANIRKGFGYEVDWLGHKAYATNLYQFGSMGFGEKFSQYDFCIAYIHDGKRFTVSLYSEMVDVSKICQIFGGGGHHGAAGFVCERLPWIE